MPYIQDLGNGKYKIYVDLGRDEFGKRRRRTKTVTATSDRDLKRQAKEFEIHCLTNHEERLDNISFKGFAKRFISNHAEMYLSIRTIESYQYLLDKYLYKKFGKMKLKDIKKMHILEYFNESQKNKKAMLPNQFRLLRTIFNKAVEWDLLTSNPMQFLKEPKREKKKVNFYNEQEMLHLMNVLDNVYPKHRIMIKLAAIGGLRRNEIAGLQEEQINFDELYINVDRQLYYNEKNKTFKLTPPKHNRSRRVFLSEKFMKELKQYITNEKKRRLEMGNVWNQLYIDDKPVDLIFVKECGYPAVPNSISNEWNKIVKRHNLKRITFHELRHSSASFMVAKGINFKLIQEHMGHADVSLTMNLYAHVDDDQERKAANVFDDIL